MIPAISRCAILLLCTTLGASFSSRIFGRQNTAASKTKAQDSLESHLGRGYEALKQENYEIAEKEFRSALSIDPKLDLRARFPLAVALFEQHKNVEARREFENVRKSAGNQPGILYYLGRLDLDERDYKGAIANLTEVSSHPPFPDTAFLLGLAYAKQGSDQNAEKWLKEAMKVNPDDSRAAYQLATLYRKQGREAEANEAFQKAKGSKAQSDQRSQMKFECSQELDRGPSEQANAFCERLNDPNDVDLLTTLGILYGQHNQLEKALPPLQRAAELAPQSPQIQYNLAYTYFQLKRYEEARAALQPAVERWPDLFPVNALYGAVLWNLNQIQPAYQALHHAHRLNPQDTGTTGLLYQAAMSMAEQQVKAGAAAEAVTYLQEAAVLAPTDPEPHRRLARIYREIGKPDKARQEERKAEDLGKTAKE